jgi:hypothetical protein
MRLHEVSEIGGSAFLKLHPLTLKTSSPPCSAQFEDFGDYRLSPENALHNSATTGCRRAGQPCSAEICKHFRGARGLPAVRSDPQSVDRIRKEGRLPAYA